VVPKKIGAGDQTWNVAAVLPVALAALAIIATTATAQKLRPFGSGTGFAISADGLFVTNNHVVAIKARNKDGAVVRGQCRALQIRGNAYNGRAKIVARDRINDIALIRLVSNTAPASVSGPSVVLHPENQNSSSLSQLLDSRRNQPQQFSANTSSVAMVEDGRSYVRLFTGKLRPGSRLSLIGFPLGESVSSQLKITTGSVVATMGWANNTSQFQLDASAYQGNSGGPILNASGDLIGILSAGIPGKSGFSFAVKAATLSRFLVSHGIKYHAAVSEQKMDAADIYEQAKHYTVFIRCFI
jgi:S1-C subfamily serine protease